LVFLNNDTVPHRGWLEALVNSIEENPGVGAAGSLLLFPDNRVQHAGVVFDFSCTPYHIYADCDSQIECVNTSREINAVTGACLLVRREAFDKVGGFDESYLNCLEDIDLCMKLRHNKYKIIYCPGSKVTHFESRSETRRENEQAAKNLFLERWEKEIKQDDLDSLIPDNMRLRVLSNGLFSFHTKQEQENLIGLQRDRGLLLLKSGKVNEAYPILRDLFLEYPYDEGLLRAMSEISEKSGASEQAKLFKKVGDKMNTLSE